MAKTKIYKDEEVKEILDKKKGIAKSAVIECKIDKLSIIFQSEDLNKLVEKINELIDKHIEEHGSI